MEKQIEIEYPASMTYERANEIVDIAESVVYARKKNFPNGGVVKIDAAELGLKTIDEMNFFWDVLCELENIETMYDALKKN